MIMSVCVFVSVSASLVTYMNREKPVVPSQLADCLGAGTGCQWCVPFLKKLHSQWQRGDEPNLDVAPGGICPASPKIPSDRPA